MNNIIFSMVVFSLILSGCAKTKEDALASFKQNKGAYVAIVEQLKLSPKIKTVNPSLKKIGLSESAGFDEKTLVTYDQLIRKVKDIDLSSIEVIHIQNNPAIDEIAFLVPSGLDKSKIIEILYIDPDTKHKKIILEGEACEVIDSPSWYLCVTDNQ
jgi:hypothetical protein